MYRMEEHIQRAELCKKEILKYRPFEGEMLDEIQNFYRIATTWASNALEGNTLTIGETKVLLEDGITVGGKPLRDTLEACGHADAYDYMFTLLHHDGITIEDISMLHQLFYQKIDFQNAGQYRKTPVRISGSEVILPPASKVPAEMDKLNRWIRENEHAMHPVAYAAELHRRFVEIHPFKDAHVIIRTKLRKPNKIKGLHNLVLIFLPLKGRWKYTTSGFQSGNHTYIVGQRYEI